MIPLQKTERIMYNVQLTGYDDLAWHAEFLLPRQAVNRLAVEPCESIVRGNISDMQCPCRSHCKPEKETAMWLKKLLLNEVEL